MTEIPDFENLKSRIQYCYEDRLEGTDLEKHKNIKRALDTIENEKIWILKIQEENTKGMKGPCKPGPHNNFYKYLLTEGSSGRRRVLKRGSHGMGKAAPIIHSHLNTIFVSTCYKEEYDEEPKKSSL